MVSILTSATCTRSTCSDSLPHLSLLERKLQVVKQMNMETDRRPVPLGKRKPRCSISCGPFLILEP